MSFGLTFDKLLLIGVIAVFLIGPERLPRAASQLASLVRTLRGFTETAKDRMRDELGPDFDEVDWAKLDPRRYDPRRIVRDALLDEPPVRAAPVRTPPTRYGPGSKHAPQDATAASPSASSPDADGRPRGQSPCASR